MKGTAPSTMNDDQRDMLAEITNIAMGQAGAQLAQLLDVFVSLSIPSIRMLNAPQLSEVIIASPQLSRDITVARQGFVGPMCGEAIVIYGKEGCAELSDLMGYEGQQTPQATLELLLDVTNIIVGACVNGIASQINLKTHFSSPSIVADGELLETLQNPAALPWKCALLMDINFALEARSFTCRLLMFAPEKSIAPILEELNRLLDDL